MSPIHQAFIVLLLSMLLVANGTLSKEEDKAKYDIESPHTNDGEIDWRSYLLKRQLERLESLKRKGGLEIEGEPLNVALNDVFPSPNHDEKEKPHVDKPTPVLHVTESKQNDVGKTGKTPGKAETSIDEQIRIISLNNPEYRMMGPNRSQEVLMGDDVGSKLVAAMDNIQEEAKELWGKVSGTVDDQWTQLKKLIERQLEKSKSTTPSPSGSRRLQSTSEIESEAPKSFLTTIGISDETQKKASDIISDAGTSIKDAATGLMKTIRGEN